MRPTIDHAPPGIRIIDDVIGLRVVDALAPYLGVHYSADTLGGFVSVNLTPGSTAISDGRSGDAELKEVKHEPKSVGPMAAHVLLPWSRRAFGNAKRWAMASVTAIEHPTCSAISTSSCPASTAARHRRPLSPRSSASP